MKNNFKKILSTTLLSLTAATTLGCSLTNSGLAKKINNGVNDFVSSINNLDYVDANKKDSSLGKIVSAANETKYLANNTSIANIENTITRPTERTDNFKLYVLSESPYITFTSDQDNNNFSLSVQFSTEKIGSTSNEINEKINKLILKRAILMVYVNEIYSGNVNLTEENRTAINAYVNVIKENASFLNGNRGMVKNQLGLANDLIENKSNGELANYYLIKSGEALEIRSNKIDSTISAIDSITKILEQNLTSSSCYYQNNLSGTYDNILSHIENTNETDENSKLAKNIAESIDFIGNIKTEQKNENSEQKSITNNQTTESTTSNVLNRQTKNNIKNTEVSPQIIDNKTQNSNEIKTQNNANNFQNNANLSQNSNINATNDNINNRNVNQNNNGVPQNQTTNNNQPSNSYLNRNQTQTQNNSQNNQVPINPTSRPEYLRNNRQGYNNIYRQTPETINSRNAQTTSINNMDETNRATRVPYRVESTNYSK